MNPYPKISRQELLSYGRVKRPHGHHGEIVLEVYSEELFALNPQYLFVESEGLCIPYRVDEMRGSRDQFITSFDQLTSEEQAKKLRGAKVYIQASEIGDEPDRIESSYLSWRGMSVTHSSGIAMGVIEEIDDSTSNLIFQILSPAGEVLLLPYVEEWIVDVDLDKRAIIVDCPIELTSPL
ncbi:MAG: ribosome maturation factor RimM [Porphyromonas sp.]|nr:ribosome maturation factor RimM [Porphyromonas sp.]